MSAFRVAFVIGLGSLAMLAAAQAADDWPQYTGPRGDSTAGATGLISEMPKEGPKVVWEAKITGSTGVKYSGSYASPVVSGGRVFIMGRAYQQNTTTKTTSFLPTPDVLHCLDAKSGQELWKQEFPPHAPYIDKTCWNTPVVDGEKVYARGPDGEMRCLDVKDGKLIWSWPKDAADIETKYIKGKKSIQGYGISGPSITVDDLVIFDIYAGFKGQLIALDKNTGQVKWEGKEYPCWQFSGGNMIVMTLGGKKVLLVNNFALDPATGNHLIKGKDEKGREVMGWSPGSIQWVSAATGNRLLTGFTRTRTVPKDQEAAEEAKYGKQWKNESGMVLLEFAAGQTPDTLTVNKVWEWSEIGTGENDSAKGFAGTVIAGDYAFVFLGRNGQGLGCFSMVDGKPLWRVKDKALKHPLGYANTILADNKIFYQYDGQLTILEANSKEYKELASAKILGPGWASPAMVGTQIFVRDDAGTVKCLELKKE